uniref:Uncharacterized protein n=1 Tax=Graphocephala atropunctata TaxID=36148 RepID=A0A1B6KWB8_9HEMI
MASKNIVHCLLGTFGKIPERIKENAKFFSYNSEYDDFICRPCDRIVKKVSNDISTTKNFNQHLLSYTHKNNVVPSSEIWINLRAIFQGKIPQVVMNNFHLLNMVDGTYKCAICDKTLTVSQDRSTTETTFSYHLLSEGHEYNLKAYREVIIELEEFYGGIPVFVLNNSQFLSKNGCDYFCNICDKHIAVHPSDLDETENSFRKHLHSLKHMRNAKENKAFSLYPKLKKIFKSLPNYMLRNVEYISVNGPNFFCSLCCQNIKSNSYDSYETEQNFKLHMSSLDHEENLDNRRDPSNDVFNTLQELFETFPDVVLKNLKYLSVNGDDFYCNICKETIEEYEEDTNVTRGNLISHFESDHKNNVEIEWNRQSELIDELGDVFGNIPELIRDNLKYIEFLGGKNFSCTLCERTMEAKYSGDYEDNTSITEENFVKHLTSSKHQEKLELIEECNKDVENDLEELFSPVPQFIVNNLEHINYEDGDENFNCYLCDKTIAIVSGTKKAELTEQNFRSHLLSSGHMAKLKQKANIEMVAIDQLEVIFHKVPNFILNNLEYLEDESDHFLCTLCDVQIKRRSSRSTEQMFRQHLFGALHKSNVMEEEQDSDLAMQRLDFSFWRLPEFLLRNIDFLSTYGDGDLFCLLCQEILCIDEDDLEETKWNLRCHMESEKHQHNFKNI